MTSLSGVIYISTLKQYMYYVETLYTIVQYIIPFLNINNNLV